MQRPNNVKDVKVTLPVQAYPTLMETLRSKGNMTVTDKGGRECVLVLDKNGLPHRQDMPHQYVKLTCHNLMDVMHTMDVMLQNATKKEDDGGKTLTLGELFHLASGGAN